MYVDTPPAFIDAIGKLEPGTLANIVNAAPQDDGDDYVHWDKLRHLTPPEGLTHKEWWIGLKLSRVAAQRRLPLTDPSGQAFVCVTPDAVFRLLHYVDQRCRGEIAMPEVVTADEQAKQHYLVNSLMEEAIRSSQLEGAVTSRRVAKELLRSGRAPKDRSERMIINNYHALQFMRDRIGDRLTPAAVIELQRILTDGTLDDPGAAGRLQTPDDERVSVIDPNDGSVLHRPPPAEQLSTRLDQLCAFANEPADAHPFIHPVVRAILLHFWLAYDHSFEDGNGRTARALFYWYMRTRGYWLVEYLSISRILRKAPAQYVRAYLLTETDERDTTYFLLYQLRVIERAVKELHTYLRRKVREVREVESVIRQSQDLNHRQLALLSYAVRNPGVNFTFRTHAVSHGVTHETARTDLWKLAGLELLEHRRAGRTHIFTAPHDLSERLKVLP